MAEAPAGGLRSSRPDWNADAQAVAEAQRVLPELARTFFAHGAAAVAEESSEEELHQFRLDVKRLRYTLELLGPLYGEAMEPLLEAMRGVQVVLGRINDIAASRELLAQQGLPIPFAFEEFLNQRTAELRLDLQREWQVGLGAPETQEQWLRVLGGIATAEPS